MTLLSLFAHLFWGLALCLGICFALSLFLGIMSESAYNQRRRRWERDIKPGKADSI